MAICSLFVAQALALIMIGIVRADKVIGIIPADAQIAQPSEDPLPAHGKCPIRRRDLFIA